jgi:outer membrane receptor protein involved in Fe transport
MYYKKIVLATIASFVTLLSIAQKQQYSGDPDALPVKGTIKGKVIDKSSGTPMEFASIALYNLADSSLVTGTISGSEGVFALNNIPPGKYYVVANFMGFEKVTVPDIMLSPRNLTFDIGSLGLAPDARELAEVEIIADQAHVEYRIDRKVVNVSQDINAATGTAADVLQNTPSVQVDIEGNVSLRGNGNFTVLIDGKPSILSGSDALQQIPASAIRNIEIITNPSAKYDPDGMAGIINVVTKKNALNGLSGIFNASVGTGDKYSTDFLLSYRTEKFNFTGGLNYSDNTYRGNSRSFSEFTGDTLRFVESSGTRNMIRDGYALKAGIDYFISESSTLSLALETGNSSFGFGGVQKQRNWSDPPTLNRYTLTENSSSRGGFYYDLNLNYTHKFKQPGHELISYFRYSSEKNQDSELQSIFMADDDFSLINGSIEEKIRTSEKGDESDYRFQADYTRPIGKDGKLEAGYQVRIDDQPETYVFENYDTLSGQWIDNPLYTSEIDFFNHIQAVYSTFGNKIGNYQYQIGLRGEYTDRRIKHANSDDAVFTKFDFFPTLHLSRSFNNNHQLMASYSRRINRPRGWDLEPFISYMDANTLRQGNPDLLPEYMNSFELGYQKTFGKSFISFEAFLKNTVNKIERVISVYDPVNAIRLMSVDNLSDDYSFGSELMLNWSQVKWLDLNLSTSLYKYWLEGNINGEDISRNSNNWDNRINATFNISSKTRLQLQGFYSGPSVTAQGTRSAYFYSNIALRQDFLDRKLSATLQVRDIFGSMKHKMTSSSPGFYSSMQYNREAQVVMLSLSYKLNNFKPQRSNDQNSQPGMGEMEMF